MTADIEVLKQGHNLSAIPYHPCKLPKRKERKALGLKYGAIVKCRICGQQWKWEEDYEGWNGYWSRCLDPRLQ